MPTLSRKTDSEAALEARELVEQARAELLARAQIRRLRSEDLQVRFDRAIENFKRESDARIRSTASNRNTVVIYAISCGALVLFMIAMARVLDPKAPAASPTTTQPCAP